MGLEPCKVKRLFSAKELPYLVLRDNRLLLMISIVLCGKETHERIAIRQL